MAQAQGRCQIKSCERLSLETRIYRLDSALLPCPHTNTYAFSHPGIWKRKITHAEQLELRKKRCDLRVWFGLNRGITADPIVGVGFNQEWLLLTCKSLNRRLMRIEGVGF